MWKNLNTFPNWDEIKKVLVDMAAQKYNSEELVKNILIFKSFSHMARLKHAEKELSGKFPVLLVQYAKQMPTIFSKVANFLLKRQNFEIPLFPTNISKEHTLTKQQILYLFCTMVLCLIPQQEFDKTMFQRSRYNIVMDFSFIFEQEPYKTNTVMEYLKTELDNQKSYDQTFKIRRQVQNKSLEEIIKEKKDEPMTKMEIKSDTTSIEEFYGSIKADFANQYLGGGSLTFGCVQQEIMFANHPQLFTAQLLCEVMEPNEAIHLMGYKKYSKNRGYARQTTYDGQQTDIKYKYDEKKMAMEYVTAIDAVCYAMENSMIQFDREHVDREILKAYAGFNFDGVESNTVVTGNWGCGAFRGDVRTKFLIQWIACSLAKKHMIYCPFGQRKNLEEPQIIDKISKMTISQSYEHLLKAAEKMKDSPSTNIYEFL